MSGGARAKTVVAGAASVAVALLGSFYSIVASAVDRGERIPPALLQADIDEDLRTPAPPAVFVSRNVASR